MTSAPAKALPDKGTLYITQEGIAKIQTQLDRLLRDELPELAQRLHEAQAGSDLVDNTEYLVLREEFVFMNDRIMKLEHILRNAQLIERGEADGKVHLGDTVVVQADEGPTETFTLVGSTETDPENGFISNESPLGAALLGRSIGDVLVVIAPDGLSHFRILAVT